MDARYRRLSRVAVNNLSRHLGKMIEKFMCGVVVPTHNVHEGQLPEAPGSQAKQAVDKNFFSTHNDGSSQKSSPQS